MSIENVPEDKGQNIENVLVPLKSTQGTKIGTKSIKQSKMSLRTRDKMRDKMRDRISPPMEREI